VPARIYQGVNTRVKKKNASNPLLMAFQRCSARETHVFNIEQYAFLSRLRSTQNLSGVSLSRMTLDSGMAFDSADDIISL
jgi:hypothetical protein